MDCVTGMGSNVPKRWRRKGWWGREEGRIIPVLYSCNLPLRPHIREFKRDDTLIINQFVEAVEYGY